MFSGEEEEGLVTGMEKDEKPTTRVLLCLAASAHWAKSASIRISEPMSSTHNHSSSYQFYQDWCHQIFFSRQYAKYFLSKIQNVCNSFSFKATELVLQNGVEFNQKSKYKLLNGLTVHDGTNATNSGAQDGLWPEIANCAV